MYTIAIFARGLRLTPFLAIFLLAWVVGSLAAPIQGQSSIPRAAAAIENAERVDRHASGSGTESDPWRSPSGTGGVSEALAAVRATRRAVYLPAGYYALTAPVTGWFDGATLLTEGTRSIFLAAPALPDGLALTVVGDRANYLEGLRLGGFHIRRRAGGSLRMQYVRNSIVGAISGDGRGGGLLSLRDVDHTRFESVSGRDLGPNGSGIFAFRVNDNAFGSVVVHGGQEAVDLYDSHRNTFARIFSRDAGDEGLDIGNSSYNSFVEVAVESPGRYGVHLKVEQPPGTWDGAPVPTGGTHHNRFANVTVIGQKLVGFVFGNGTGAPNGVDVNSWNDVERLTVRSSQPQSTGVRLSVGSNPPSVGNRIRQFTIDVQGDGISAHRQERLTLERGTIASAHGYAFRGALLQDATLVGLDVEGGRGIVIERSSGVRLEESRVATVSQHCLHASGSDRLRIARNTLTDCGRSGVTVVMPERDDLALDVDIVENAIVNTGVRRAQHYAVELINSYAHPARGILVKSNRLEDTQSKPTTGAIHWSGSFVEPRDRDTALHRVVGGNR